MWIGAVAYSLQILFDFSGYSDMAIGLGKIFGFEFLENFDYPYISKSVTEFWRRWHMSLGTWFRDYVYIPIGGNRVGKGRHIFNLFIVWFLTGLWHGANWTFVVWGLGYFIILVIEKYTHIDKAFEKKLHFIPHFYTMFLVILGWVIFRSDTIAAALSFIAGMFGPLVRESSDAVLIKQYLGEYVGVFLLSFAFLIPWKNCFRVGEKLRNVGTVLGDVCCFLMLIVSVSYIMKGSYSPFIYFNF